MSRTKKNQQQEQLELEEKPSKLLWLIVCIIAGCLMFFALSKTGLVGTTLNNVFTYFFGSFYIVGLLTIFAYAIYIIFFSSHFKRTVITKIGLLLLNLDVMVLCAMVSGSIDTLSKLWSYILINFLPMFSETPLAFSGGVVGSFIYCLLYKSFDTTGTIVTLVVTFIISMLLIVPTETYQAFFNDLKENRTASKKARQEEKLQRKLEKQQQEIERKQRQAEEMAKLAEEEYKKQEQLETEQVEEQEENSEPIRKHTEVLSHSRTFINLNDDEIYGKGNKPPVKKTSSSTTISIPQEENKETSSTKTKILRVQRNGRYHLPTPYDEFLEVNTSKSSSVNKTSAAVKGEKVIEILETFDIKATLTNTYIGPSVTKFEIKPESNVKINKIMNIQDNIKMELAARDIRIEAPIPGRSAVGVEIPNVEPIPVKMLDLMKTIPTDKKKVDLLFCLGKDLMGKGVYCDLSKMPHLLIAGATGSGKSVCINSIITSFLLRTNPDDVKLVLVDPKKVEFTPYKDIPHLLWPIIDDATMASNMLKKIVVMMEERYDAFAACGVRNIASFNEYVLENNAHLKDGASPMSKLPYIVVIIDELADLMAIARKDVEMSIQRITQLARASGIHLIVATQRPSTDVITGLIKSNIPSRISFAVASSIDSRTILDATGAERLLGNGDMLYCPQGENAPIRLQGVFVTDKEIRKITDYVKKQAKPTYEDSYFEFLTNMNGTTVMAAGGSNADTMDSLYNEVVEYVTSAQKASTSLLQRRFGIGYNRAARLIDTLEDRGIIGPANGSKPREVYKKLDEE